MKLYPLVLLEKPVEAIEAYEASLQISPNRFNSLYGAGRAAELTAKVQATTHPTEAPKADVALICVNGYATRDAAQTAKVILKNSGYALTLQNGLGNIEILTNYSVWIGSWVD